MARRGYKMEESITKKNIDILKHYVISCIRIVGDTKCRNHQFSLAKWSVVKDVVIAGKYVEISQSMECWDETCQRYPGSGSGIPGAPPGGGNPPTDDPPGGSGKPGGPPGELAPPGGADKPVPPKMLENCIKAIEKSKMEKCYHGLYDALTALVIQKEEYVAMELHDIENPACLSTVMKHCDKEVIAKIESIISSTFGTCIKLSDKSKACQVEKDFDVKSSCGASDVMKINQILHKCGIRKKGKFNKEPGYSENEYKMKRRKRQYEYGESLSDENYDVVPDSSSVDKSIKTEEVLEDMESCLDREPSSCIYTKWEVFEELLGNLLNRISETEIPDGDAENIVSYRKKEQDSCRSELSLENLQFCGKQLVSLVSILQETNVGISESNMKPVSNCFQNALALCPDRISNLFLEILEALTNTDYLATNKVALNYRSPFINSIKANDSVVSVCEQSTTEGALRDDICAPIRYRSEEDSPMFMLRRSCLPTDIERWMEKVTQCVWADSKVHGLQDPASLTIKIVTRVLEGCLDKVGPVWCVPKKREDFKFLLSSVLWAIRKNSVIPSGDFCHTSLIVENIGKCLHSLHQFTLIKAKTEDIKKEKKKSRKCLEKALRKCSGSYIDNLLVVIEKSAQGDEKTNFRASHESYSTCEPGTEIERWLEYCNPWPGGVGYYPGPTNPQPHHGHQSPDSENRADKPFRGIHGVKEGEHLHRPIPGSNENDLEYDYIPILEENLQRINIQEVFANHVKRSVVGKRGVEEAHVTGCLLADFERYFDNIQKCLWLRLKLAKGNGEESCESQWMVSLKSYSLCLLENNENLHCKNDDLQFKEYLHYLNLRLHRDLKLNTAFCQNFTPCYGYDILDITSCTEDLHHLTENSLASTTNNPNWVGLYQCLQKCFKSCANSVSLLTMPIISAPLGVDLANILNKTEDRTCITMTTNVTDFKEACTDDHRDEAIERLNSCLEKVTSHYMQRPSDIRLEPHWHIYPLYACTTLRPIIKCKETDRQNFKRFMEVVLSTIKSHLVPYVAHFQSKNQNVLHCMKQFSAPALNMCMNILYGFMKNYHNGLASLHEFPHRCLDKVFQPCGDVKSFHVIAKKIMQMPVNEVVDEKLSDLVSDRACVKHADWDFPKCLDKTDESYVLENDPCTAFANNANNNHNYLNQIIEKCKNCTLKMLPKMCYHDNNDMQALLTKSLKNVGECLRASKLSGRCVLEIVYVVEKECSSFLHECSDHIRKGDVMKAIRKSRDFYDCIQSHAGHCSALDYKKVLDLYTSITGLGELGYVQ